MANIGGSDPLDKSSILLSRTIQQHCFSFQKICEADLPTILSWVNQPHVQEGYSLGPSSWEEVQQDYHPSILHKQGIDGFIILYQNKYIGYIQKYILSDNDYQLNYSDAAGFDIFIGESEYLNMGLGKYIIYLFLKHYIFITPGINQCIINPRPNNIRAIKAYLKLGFKYLTTYQVEENIYEYLLELTSDRLIRPEHP